MEEDDKRRCWSGKQEVLQQTEIIYALASVYEKAQDDDESASDTYLCVIFTLNRIRELPKFN